MQYDASSDWIRKKKILVIWKARVLIRMEIENTSFSIKALIRQELNRKITLSQILGSGFLKSATCACFFGSLFATLRFIRLLGYSRS